MRIVFMGSPGFAVPSLERLAGSGYEVAAVYTQPDRPAGRGRPVTFSPVKQEAIELGLNIVQPLSLKTQEEIERAADLKPDVIVVAAYGKVLPEDILEIPPYGCINIHPSLLPRHRGPSPVAAAILAGDEFTGVSIMKMDEGLDTGPIMTRAQIPVTGQDTTGSLTEKLSVIAADLIQDVLIHWMRQELNPRPQNDDEASYSSIINKEAGEINWCQSSAAIWRQIRAFQPWPGAFTFWKGKRLEIIQGFPLPWPGKAAAGQVIDLKEITDRAGFGVATNDGLLGVCYVQLEGRQITPAQNFINGQRGFLGAVLPD